MKMKTPNKKAVKNYKKPAPTQAMRKAIKAKAKKPTRRSPKKY
jgi:hypothetical protein